VRDVLITDSLDRGIRRAVRALPLEDRPRLIIVLSSEEAQPLQAPEPFCPPGVSFLWVPALLSLGGEFLQAFLYGLIHDLPLHEALKSALRTLNAQQAGAFLVTDPQGNHDLRLLDALAELRKEGILLDATIGAPDMEGFLDRWGAQLGATVSQELRAAFAGAPQLGGRELLTNAITGARGPRGFRRGTSRSASAGRDRSDAGTRTQLGPADVPDARDHRQQSGADAHPA